MGRIVAQVSVRNAASGGAPIVLRALVDTGAAYLALPAAWKQRLGELEVVSVVDAELADRSTVRCEICGPVRLQIEGFREAFGEVLFMEMTPTRAESTSRSSGTCHSNNRSLRSTSSGIDSSALGRLI